MTRIYRLGLCATTLALLTAPAFAAQPSGTFRVSQLTAIPGKTLPPGQYTIHVVDHLSDRYILEVAGDGGESTLFLGVPDAHLRSAHTGMVRYAQHANQADYIRGWRFASLPTAIEFVYPKADAVAVAKANSVRVPAIDPPSDHMQAADLSQNQMQIVTLWLLTPTSVGPNAPAGITAARYDTVASARRPPVIKSLPHTAGMQPWVWLAAAFSLLGGIALRTRALIEGRGARVAARRV